MENALGNFHEDGCIINQEAQEEATMRDYGDECPCEDCQEEDDEEVPMFIGSLL